jgi:hypothetical protein
MSAGGLSPDLPTIDAMSAAASLRLSGDLSLN